MCTLSSRNWGGGTRRTARGEGGPVDVKAVRLFVLVLDIKCLGLMG